MTSLGVPKTPVVDNYLTYTRGFWSWAKTLDHKRIGLMYLAGVSLAFLAGGLLAANLALVFLPLSGHKESN